MRLPKNRHGIAVAIGLLTSALAPSAFAGDFDLTGEFISAADATAVQLFEEDFDKEALFTAVETPIECLGEDYELVASEDALAGGHYLKINPDITEGCALRVLLDVPKEQASYTARVWMRHGAIDAQVSVIYPPASGLSTHAAELTPTGRVTSDGWVEMASNPFPIDGGLVDNVYLRVFDFDSTGSEIDALELLPNDAPFWQQQGCNGVADPVCGERGLCIHNNCRLATMSLPVLPADEIRGQMVDMMQSQLRMFYGGRKTRLEDLPSALDKLDEIRTASDAFAFWNGWGTAMRRLHDWHTRASSDVNGVSRRARLNLCFFEGDGDTSELAWPKHPKYKDLLVSHVGVDGTHGIAQGDRLVAVDGMHPIEWALSLRDKDWGYWQANDANVFSEMAERMRGLILAYATSFSVIHCDKNTLTCEDTPETFLTAALPPSDGGQVRCDNRPFYHFAPSQNPSGNHSVGFNFFRGPVVDAPAEDKVYGLVWDTLSGGGDPDGFVNTQIKNAYADFRANARGVILDHRAGNGGTLDAAELVTTLVRPPEKQLIFFSPIQQGGFSGPDTAAEGVELFNVFKGQSVMTVGAPDYDPDMPVAVVLHRDGSASDYMPFGMKGAPKVRLFGPGPTAGAFSTFYELRYWGGINLRLASGDSISKDGKALIGHGVVPDVIVLPKQSDLLAGKDTIFDAALTWVRSELKP